MITIKKNEYAKPTEIRENVVQDIIDAFLDKSCWSVCHMDCDPTARMGRYRGSYVLKRNGEKAYGFHHEPFSADTESTRYHECEMRMAFKILRENGYHIFKRHYFGTWGGYVVRNADFCEGGVEVTDFTERWE